MPLRVKKEVVCSAGALLGTVSASSANLDMFELACSVGFVRGAVFCCELIDKEEGIFRKLELDEDLVNQMIMDAREKSFS